MAQTWDINGNPIPDSGDATAWDINGNPIKPADVQRPTTLHRPGPNDPLMGTPVLPVGAGALGPVQFVLSTLGTLGGAKFAGDAAAQSGASPRIEEAVRLVGGLLGGGIGMKLGGGAGGTQAETPTPAGKSATDKAINILGIMPKFSWLPKLRDLITPSETTPAESATSRGRSPASTTWSAPAEQNTATAGVSPQMPAPSAEAPAFPAVSSTPLGSTMRPSINPLASRIPITQPSVPPVPPGQIRRFPFTAGTNDVPPPPPGNPLMPANAPRVQVTVPPLTGASQRFPFTGGTAGVPGAPPAVANPFRPQVIPQVPEVPPPSRFPFTGGTAGVPAPAAGAPNPLTPQVIPAAGAPAPPPGQTYPFTGRTPLSIFPQAVVKADPMTDLLDEVTNTMTKGRITSFGSPKLSDSERQTIQWAADAISKQQGTGPTGLLADQTVSSTPATAPLSKIPAQTGLLQQETAEAVQPEAEGGLLKDTTPVEAKPWAEFGDNEQAKAKYYKIKNIGQFLRSDDYLNWEDRPADLNNSSEADVKKLYAKAKEYADANDLPGRPQKKFTNPDPKSDTFLRILKEGGINEEE